MSTEFRKYFDADMVRYGGKPSRYLRVFHKFFRKTQTTKNKILSFYYRFRLKQIESKNGLEIPRTVRFGKGLFLCHPYNITINPEVVFGENINIHKGVTIGQENRGKRKGVPTIGNCVWIGINACIVGNVVIGNDVLIAPNSYVNCDVPSHSVVFGNPCIIKPKQNATEGYLSHTI